MDMYTSGYTKSMDKSDQEMLKILTREYPNGNWIHVDGNWINQNWITMREIIKRRRIISRISVTIV